MNFRIFKVNQVLLFLVLLTVILYYGKQPLILLFFAALLAMLMAPLCRRLDNKGLRRAVSCLVCVAILLVIFLGMLAILVGQISGFVKDVSLLEQNANALLVSVQDFIEQKFDIPAAEQMEFIQNETKNIGRFLRNYLTGVLRSSVQLLAGLIITLVLTFLFLFHKEKYYSFFLKYTPGDTRQQKKDLLTSIGQVSQRYLVGRAISILSLTILYAVALLIIGIKNALLLAAVAGLFNIIPFLGPILAAIFPFLVALVTEDSYQPSIWVLVSFCLFQALDNYYITPYFLGGEVSLSALSTIVIIICGGFVWGIAGMILFIPMLSIAKIIFDAIPGLQPYGELIGDPSGTRPSASFRKWISRLFSRKEKGNN
jgi:predicted PurR-regulated permease PerM